MNNNKAPQFPCKTLFDLVFTLQESYLNIVSQTLEQGVRDTLSSTLKLKEKAAGFRQNLETTYHPGIRTINPKACFAEILNKLQPEQGVKLPRDEINHLMEKIIEATQKQYHHLLALLDSNIDKVIYEFQLQDISAQTIHHLTQTYDIINKRVVVVFPAIYESIAVTPVIDAIEQSASIKKQKTLLNNHIIANINELEPTLPAIDLYIMYMAYYKKTLRHCVLSLEKSSLNLQAGIGAIQTGFRELKTEIDSYRQQIETCINAIAHQDSEANTTILYQFSQRLTQVSYEIGSIEDSFITLLMPLQFNDRICQQVKNLLHILFLTQKTLFASDTENISLYYQDNGFKPLVEKLRRTNQGKEEKDLIQSIFC